MGYLSIDLGERQNGRGLLMHEGSEPGLSLNEQEWDLLPPAELRQPKDNLNRIDVVRHDHELGSAFLDEPGDVVEPILDYVRNFLVVDLFTLGLKSSGLSKPVLLLGSGLGLVFL